MGKSTDNSITVPTDAVDALDDAALEALLAHARAVQEARGDSVKRAALLLKAEYTESITDFVTKAMANEEPRSSDKWVGYSVRGLDVVVDGHAFTVSVTITDTQATTAKKEELKLAEAQALIAAKAAEAAASA